jgi:hypothetical protein
MRSSIFHSWLGLSLGSPDAHFCTLFYLGNIFKDTLLDRSAHFLVSFISLFLADTQFAFGDYINVVVPAISTVLVKGSR